MNFIPIIFVGYDSILPQNPEKDRNILLINNYFSNFNSLYIPVEKSDSIFQIVDRNIELDALNPIKMKIMKTISF